MRVALRSSLNFDIDKPFDTELAFKIYQQTFGIFALIMIANMRRLSIGFLP